MPKEHPDHHDGDLLLKIYDLRREPVMRESRATLLRDYWPRAVEDALAVLKSDHPLNREWRQVTTYWEMVYGMARWGVIHADFLVDNSGEGMVFFARAEPYLAELRERAGPRMLRNSEWIANETETGRKMMELMRARVQKHLAGNK